VQNGGGVGIRKIPQKTAEKIRGKKVQGECGAREEKKKRKKRSVIEGGKATPTVEGFPERSKV